MTETFNVGETVYFLDSFGSIGLGKIKKIRTFDDPIKPITFYTIKNTVYIEDEVFKKFEEALAYTKTDDFIDFLSFLKEK